jgi:hypothetical protein
VYVVLKSNESASRSTIEIEIEIQTDAEQGDITMSFSSASMEEGECPSWW